MVTRLVGVDSANPRLPDVVVEAMPEFVRPRVATGTKVVWYGDSFTFGGGIAEYTDDTNKGPVSWIWCERVMMDRLKPLGNEGAGGETTSQFLARINDVTAHGADIVGLLTSGVNDVKGAVTSATTIANLTSIFDTLNDAGMLVICGTVPPSDLINTVDEIAALFAVNRWLMAEAQRRTGLIVVDIYSLLADQSLTLIDWRTDYDSDGTHPNSNGAFVIGQAMAEALDKVIPSTASSVIRSKVDPEELMPNPCMTGTGGVGTGTIPASTTQVGGTGTGTKVARTDGIPGDWFQWANTSGTNTILQLTTTGYSAGQRLVARVELDCDVAPAAVTSSYYVYVEQRNSSNVVVGPLVQELMSDTGPAPIHGKIIVKSNPVVVHADAVGGNIRVAIRQVGAGTIRVGLMSLREVDA